MIHAYKKHRHRFDLAVVGAGAGGFAAAWTAARAGARVAVIERTNQIGGNAVRGGVHCWEPVAGATGVPFDVYQRLRTIPGASGIYSFGRHCLWYDASREPYPFPGAELLIDPAYGYEDTLCRAGTRGLADDAERCRRQWHGVIFEPDAMESVMRRALQETGNVTLLLGRGFTGISHTSQRVDAIELDDGTGIAAEAFIDATADGLLCTAAGCVALTGREARSVFSEPSAPEAGSDEINGVSLIFRVTPREQPAVDPIPENIPASCWWATRFPLVSVFRYPNGDLNVNMLPTMQGRAFQQYGYPAAYAECQRRVAAAWHHLQRTYEEFAHYRISWVAPALGIRESQRIICEYMLTEHDLIQGLGHQSHPDIIAVTDHAMDTHGVTSRGCGELNGPYGIPLRCLVPKGFTNLFISCRAAGFSAIAASSCRLTRTMMQLGQAAGLAAIGVQPSR